MATINEFKANMVGGGARPNQFVVRLNFPQRIANATTGIASRQSEFLCRAASLPPAILQDIVVGFRGRPVHFAGERDFQPWTISVLNDTNFNMRDALEYWSDRIVNFDRTNGLLSPQDYMTDLEVTQLDRDDNPLKTYVFYDAWPTTVGEIQLSFDQNNQIEEFPVQFSYNYYLPLDRPR